MVNQEDRVHIYIYILYQKVHEKINRAEQNNTKYGRRDGGEILQITELPYQLTGFIKQLVPGS